MSHVEVYQEIRAYLGGYLQPKLSRWTLDRVSLLVSGMIKAQQVAPARMAAASQSLSERGARAESIERRLRRIENDPKIAPDTCFRPLVKPLLACSGLNEVWLIVDPTLQEDRVVLVSVNLWYRGRSLPLEWTIWPANRPLQGAGFWQRVGKLLHKVQRLLPKGVVVTVLADRAFGSPAFTDQVSQLGWHWIVRVQGQTRCRDRGGREIPVVQLVQGRGQRRKLYGQVFKKAGWRSASVVVYWGKRFRQPLCLVSDRPPAWELIALYRHRFPIEPTFRDWKAYGWHWEHSQVSNLEHLKRLILGMALATWLTLLGGARQAEQLLARRPSGRRRTRPYAAKQSLFHLGLQWWADCFASGSPPVLGTSLPDGNAPNWSTQITAHYAQAFLFA